MDVVQAITIAAALLAPYLAKAGEGFAKKAGERVWEKVEALYRAVRRKVEADKGDGADKTLERLQAEPINETRKAGLTTILTEKTKSDAGFAQELVRLVQGVVQTEHEHAVQFLTEVYGPAQVGKIINIGHAGTVHIE